MRFVVTHISKEHIYNATSKTCLEKRPWLLLQVKLQHLVTLHVRSSAFGSKLDAGMFMKALSVQYDVWAENHYQRMLSVGSLSIARCVCYALSMSRSRCC